MKFDHYTGGSQSPHRDLSRLPDDEKPEWVPYEASPELQVAVNTAIVARQALLLTGDPGTGKSSLARSVAYEMHLKKVLEFHVGSEGRAKNLLYHYDALERFRDASAKLEKANSPEPYITTVALGKAIESGEVRVVLIDEIDKAPRDFPNDLLDVLDRRQFTIEELRRTHRAKDDAQPIIIITSNGERELPDAFLRRCVFHNLDFPGDEALKGILKRHLPADDVTKLDAELGFAIRAFMRLRENPKISKKPSPAELIVWLRLLITVGGLKELVLRAEGNPEKTRLSELPYLGTLIKRQSDIKVLSAADGGPGPAGKR